MDQAVSDVIDGVEHLFSPALRTNMVARAHIDSFEPISLLCDRDGVAGWVGLVVYPDHPHAWETTTFFAPSLRGAGLFGWAKCWQAHAFLALTHDSAHHLTLLTSISQANTRSIDATTRYARAHGWPSGQLREEPSKDRVGWIFEWPDDLTHTCIAGSETP